MTLIHRTDTLRGLSDGCKLREIQRFKTIFQDAVPPARIPAWLKSEELTAASVSVQDEYRVRTEPIDQLAADGLDRLVRASMKRELSYITNLEFEVSGVGEQIFSETLGLSSPTEASDSKSRSALADLPVHLGRMCEAPLLTPKQEALLFPAHEFLDASSGPATLLSANQTPLQGAVEVD